MGGLCERLLVWGLGANFMRACCARREGRRPHKPLLRPPSPLPPLYEWFHDNARRFFSAAKGGKGMVRLALLLSLPLATGLRRIRERTHLRTRGPESTLDTKISDRRGLLNRSIPLRWVDRSTAHSLRDEIDSAVPTPKLGSSPLQLQQILLYRDALTIVRVSYLILVLTRHGQRRLHETRSEQVMQNQNTGFLLVHGLQIPSWGDIGTPTRV